MGNIKFGIAEEHMSSDVELSSKFSSIQES